MIQLNWRCYIQYEAYHGLLNEGRRSLRSKGCDVNDLALFGSWTVGYTVAQRQKIRKNKTFGGVGYPMFAF